MTLKIYTKGARVLRVEVIVHNTKAYRWGRSLPCFGEIVTRLRGILERFLNAVGCLGACFVADDTLENLPLPAQVGQTKVGGIDFNKPRMRQLAEAVLALSTSPTSPAGFTASDLAQKVCKPSPRCWSSVKKSSDPYSPPANGPSRSPNRIIRHKSITITNISGPACETCLRPWGWPHKDRQSFFRLFK